MVRGDFAGSDESGPQALAGMLGLVGRPLLALAMTTPLALRVTRESARWAHTSAIYVSAALPVADGLCIRSRSFDQVWGEAEYAGSGRVLLFGARLSECRRSHAWQFCCERRGVREAFYRLVYPLLLHAAVVLAPAMWGTRMASRARQLLAADEHG